MKRMRGPSSPRRELAERYAARLAEWAGEHLVSAVLFGSVARGDDTERSDIDLLLVFETPSAPSGVDWHRALLAWEKDTWGGARPEIAPLVLSREEADRARWIYLDMTVEGKILSDRGGFMRERLRTMRKKMEALGTQRVLLEDGSWFWDLKPGMKYGEVVTL